jgi:phosphoglycolate phosphatase
MGGPVHLRRGVLHLSIVSAIEFTASFRARPIRHVLMDWDGTTALSRTGWADLMLDIYLEHLPLSEEESDTERRALAWDELMRLNGRPSIHQMGRLAEMVRERGGNPATAQDYQADFQQRLTDMVHERLQQIHAGDRAPHTLLIPGVSAFLAALHARGMRMTLASGTPQPQLREEAELLGIAQYFEGRVFGPADTHDTHFSKRGIIAALVREDGIGGDALLAFGDGPVELSETKAVGGLAVAVASNEEQPGELDAWKRETLLAAGADAVIADFRDSPTLLQAFFAL